MPLPVTLPAGTNMAPGESPVFRGRNGSYYALVFSTVPNIRVVKSTDPTTSFSTLLGSSTTGALACMQTVRSGDTLHCAYMTSGAELYYISFNMTTEVLSTAVSVSSLSGMDGPGTDVLWCSIVYSEGATNPLVVAASGYLDKDMGTDYERADYWYSSDGSSWTGPLSMDASVAARSEIQPTLALGRSNRVHMLWGSVAGGTGTLASVTNARYRTASGTTWGTLSTAHLTTVEVGQTIMGRGNAISLYNGGSQYMIVPHRKITTARPALARFTENGSFELQSGVSSLEVPTNDAQDVAETGESGIIRCAQLGETMYTVWSGGNANGTDKDGYYVSSTNAGTSFSSVIEYQDAVTINQMAVNLISRAGNRVIGVLYLDGTTVKYNEIALAASSVSFLSAVVMTQMDHSFPGPFEV